MGVSVVFKTFLKHVLEIHRDKELIEVIEHKNGFENDIDSKVTPETILKYLTDYLTNFT